MIVSKQALSYMKIRDVALLRKVSTDPNLFFAKKRRITGSLQFCIVSSCIFSLSCLAYFTAVKSQRSCMNTSKSKNCQVGTSFVLQSLSLSPCHSLYLAIISIFALILAYFDRSCHKSASCECIICLIWRRVCLSKSTCVQSDTTLRRNPTVS